MLLRRRTGDAPLVLGCDVEIAIMCAAIGLTADVEELLVVFKSRSCSLRSGLWQCQCPAITPGRTGDKTQRTPPFGMHFPFDPSQPPCRSAEV